MASGNITGEFDNRLSGTYSTGALDAISATDHPIHLQRSLMGVTTMHITTDAGVTADRTLYLGLRGV